MHHADLKTVLEGIFPYGESILMSKSNFACDSSC